MKPLIDNMQKRIPFGVAKGIFKDIGIKSSVGWDKTKDKLLTGNLKNSEQYKLENAYLEHLLCG